MSKRDIKNERPSMKARLLSELEKGICWISKNSSEVASFYSKVKIKKK